MSKSKLRGFNARLGTLGVAGLTNTDPFLFSALTRTDCQKAD